MFWLVLGGLGLVLLLSKGGKKRVFVTGNCGGAPGELGTVTAKLDSWATAKGVEAHLSCAPEYGMFQVTTFAADGSQLTSQSYKSLGALSAALDTGKAVSGWR